MVATLGFRYDGSHDETTTTSSNRISCPEYTPCCISTDDNLGGYAGNDVGASSCEESPADWLPSIVFASGHREGTSTRQDHTILVLIGGLSQVLNACLLIRRGSYESCLIYPSPNHAISCREHLLQSAKDEFSADDIAIRTVDLDSEQETRYENTSNRGSTIRLYAIFFPENLLQTAMAFWRLTGTGISSRLAQMLHKNLETLREAPFDPLEAVTTYQGFRGKFSDPGAMKKLRERISSLLKRASISPASNIVSGSDIYLYPTGMSAIYHCNILLQTWMPTESIVFGFPYELTLKMLQTYGTSCRFYGFGTPDELKQLETYLQSEARQGRRVQSVWCECASNPLLRTVDLNGIRVLADKFGFQVVVDDTIGSFANIDVLGVADIVVTSLTKSFSGNGDVMGGRYFPAAASCVMQADDSH